MMDYSYGIVTTDKPQTAPITNELPERPKLRQVAKWLGLSYPTVRRMVLDGEIPCRTIKRQGKTIRQRKNNIYLFDKAALLEWEKAATY